VVRNPRRIIDVAEGYAAGGIQFVKEMMEAGHHPASDKFTRSLVKILSANEGANDDPLEEVPVG